MVATIQADLQYQTHGLSFLCDDTAAGFNLDPLEIEQSLERTSIVAFYRFTDAHHREEQRFAA